MWSRNDDICSVGPSQPDIIGLPVKVLHTAKMYPKCDLF